jgi:cytosine/adenosine deaminase-related metal-dependent hydrolase
VHLSEQTAENDACRTAHDCTPTRLLADHGVLGPRTTGVHNTHLTDEDIALLARPGRAPACAPPPNETWPTASAPP